MDTLSPLSITVMVATVLVIFGVTWAPATVFLRGYTPRYTPLPNRCGSSAPARHTFYVTDGAGRPVPLDEALADLGLVADGE